MIRRLRETTAAKPEKALPRAHGIGTPIAGYAEGGPYHCNDCKYIRSRSKRHGACDEKHMKADPKTKKLKNGMALVKLETGCCEYVDPGKKNG